MTLLMWDGTGPMYGDIGPTAAEAAAVAAAAAAEAAAVGEVEEEAIPPKESPSWPLRNGPEKA